MNLGLYLTVFWRRKWLIVAVLATVLGVVFIIDQRTLPTYQSTALVRVSISAKALQTPTLFNYSNELMNTFIRVANSSSVRSGWMKRLETDSQPQVTLEAVSGTELVRITVTSPNRNFAAKAANAYADLLVDQGRQFFTGTEISAVKVIEEQLEQSFNDLNKVRTDYEALLIQTPAPTEKIAVVGQALQEKQRTYETLLRQVEQAQQREALEMDMITVVESATPSPIHSQYFDIKVYLAAVLAALLLGVMLVSVFEHFDTRIYASHEIESIVQTQVLAKLPKTSPNHLHISKNGTSPLAGSIRHLAARLKLADDGTKHKTIAIIGAETGQGVTMTVVNLGMALEEQGKRVVMVDLNLHDPNLHNIFNQPNEKGVTDLLARGMDASNALQFIKDGKLALLSTGPVAAHTLQYLDNTQVESLLRSLCQSFDYILLDTPPVDLADVVIIAAHADELILVARRSHVRRESVRSAGEFLSSFKEKFIGLILNEVESQNTYIAS